jgi:hypothetical protein
VVKKIKIDPGLGAAAFGAAQYAAVKSARCMEVGDVKRKVE